MTNLIGVVGYPDHLQCAYETKTNERQHFNGDFCFIAQLKGSQKESMRREKGKKIQCYLILKVLVFKYKTILILEKFKGIIKLLKVINLVYFGLKNVVLIKYCKI